MPDTPIIQIFLDAGVEASHPRAFSYILVYSGLPSVAVDLLLALRKIGPGAVYEDRSSLHVAVGGFGDGGVGSDNATDGHEEAGPC